MFDGDLFFEVREGDGAVVVRVAGEIDMSTAPRFEAVVHAAGDTAAVLVLDVSDVSYMDSSGLRVLMTVNRARGEGGRIHLRGASTQLRRLLAITGIDRDVILDEVAVS